MFNKFIKESADEGTTTFVHVSYNILKKMGEGHDV